MVAPRLSRVLLALSPLLVGACDPDQENSVFANNGTLCFKSTPTGSVRMRVTFPACLSSSCDYPVIRFCGIREENGVIRASSRGEIGHEGTTCTDDCGSFTADCESRPIASGTYAVTYGSNNATLTLPANGQILFDDSGFGMQSCPE
jgi:hypothetical protein